MRFDPNRRKALSRIAALALAPGARASAADRDGAVTRHSSPVTSFKQVLPGRPLRFPDDEGSHPGYRIEWWYVTGWLEAGAHGFGFQVTFFRAEPERGDESPSAFAPRQIYLAHAALSDPGAARLVTAERAARDAFGLAGARQGRTDVWIDDWSLAQRGRLYETRIATPALALDLSFEPTQPPLLHGVAGMSRKGPRPESASYYYSLPHLAVRGTVARDRQALRVSGAAWLDHEWSSQFMDERAQGWDWIGINLDGGGALMAFRMRDKQGGTLWAGGTLRTAAGATTVFSPHDVTFTPRRRWRSPRTGTVYPTAFTVRAGGLVVELEPLMDDQENDTRASTGTIYWEGAVRARSQGRIVGRGYLELTGYWRELNL